MLAEEWDAEGILNLMVLEQFIARLLAETAEWVQCHQPVIPRSNGSTQHLGMQRCEGILPSYLLSWDH